MLPDKKYDWYFYQMNYYGQVGFLAVIIALHSALCLWLIGLLPRIMEAEYDPIDN